MTEDQAVDAILTQFKTYWEANSPALNGGTAPGVEYHGIKKLDPPATADQQWARVSVIHNDGGQASLGGTGGRNFERLGVVMVQCFAPAGDSRGAVRARRLARVARDAFEGQRAGDAWFRGCRIREIGPAPDGPWYQYNAIADFTYDEIK